MMSPLYLIKGLFFSPLLMPDAPKVIVPPIAPIEEPVNRPLLTLAQILIGPPIAPEKRVETYSDKEFEEFISEWAFYYLKLKANKYHQISLMGGAGDKGRDIVAYIDPVSSGGKIDIFQCKHYASALGFSDIRNELAKLCYFTYIGTFVVPENYRLVAPKDTTSALNLLLEKPDELKEKLIEHWMKNPAEKIIKGLKIKFEGGLKKYVEEFDFSIVGVKTMQEIINEHRETPRYAQRFGGGLVKPCPADQIPPANIEAHEQRYVEQLVEAYSDACKIKDLQHQNLTHPYDSHFKRARQNYYCAETLKAYARDNYIEGSDFDVLQQGIYDGVIDVAESVHANGFERVKSTAKAAIDMAPCDHPLNPFVQPKTKHGICHQLANEDKLTWVPNGKSIK